MSTVCEGHGYHTRDGGTAANHSPLKGSYAKRSFEILFQNTSRYEKSVNTREKTYDRIQAGIIKSMGNSLERLLCGLSIPNVGSKMALVLAEHFKTMDALMAASIFDLENIPDVGPIAAQNIYNYFNNPDHKNMIDWMKLIGVNMNYISTAKSSASLSGKTFVITGTLTQPRKYYEDLIKANGGTVTGSVSSKTDYLLLGENPGSKLDKAKSLGIKILSEDDFTALVK